jgi:ankyrin repeat protein
LALSSRIKSFPLPHLEQKGNQEATALMEAAKHPYAETVKLLIAKGANVNVSTPDGYTALIYAAYNGRNENVKLLLDAGADPNATGDNQNAAEWAESQGFRETAALIRGFKK